MEITKLFQLCLRKGYHPLVFKNTTLCALPKLEKRPQKLTQSYRLIVPLFSLGKALKKIVPRRLGQMALKYHIVSSFYFREIASRSVIDVTTTLTHNVKKTFNRKYIFTILALDIKRAFDRVIKKRLIKHLYEQNILLPLIRWVISFLTNRFALIKLDRHTRNQDLIQIGDP